MCAEKTFNFTLSCRIWSLNVFWYQNWSDLICSFCIWLVGFLHHTNAGFPQSFIVFVTVIVIVIVVVIVIVFVFVSSMTGWLSLHHTAVGFLLSFNLHGSLHCYTFLVLHLYTATLIHSYTYTWLNLYTATLIHIICATLIHG